MALPSNAPGISVDVKGLRQLNRQLKKLTGREATNIMRAATRAAAVEIKKEAAKKLPTYHRKKLDVVRSRKLSSKITHVFRVGPKAAHWGLIFLEYGVPPHEITPKTKRALVSTIGDDIGTPSNAASKVKHPGIKRLAFLSRAINEGQQKSIAAFSKKANDRIKKALTKR